MFKTPLLFFAVFIFISNSSFSQESAQINPDRNLVPFYKWEVGIDLLPLVDKSKDAYGYIVKRNYQAANGRKALRFKLLPRFVTGPGTGSGADGKQSVIYFAVGYERQRMYGRFSVLYGVESYLRYSSISIKSTSTGLEVLKQIDTSLGVAGFIGGRYYVGNHVSFTLESHLIYQYRDQNGSFSNVGSYFSREHQLSAEPLHALYVSYQF